MPQTDLTEQQRDLLQELICTRGPAGIEEEVAEVCERELRTSCDETWRDGLGNVIGLIKAEGAERNEASKKAVRIMAHMDEIALIVKRVYGEGQLRVIKLGGLLPLSFGQIPVDIIADKGVLPGILCIGSLHVTKETAHLNRQEPDRLDWEDVFIATRLTNEELAAKGVHAGTRVVVGQYMRRLFDFHDCIAGHFMDDRALLVVGLETMKRIAEKKDQLKRDVYMTCTVKEEVTCEGALYAAKNLPGEDVIALEVGPVAAEYDTKLCEQPIVLYGDMRGFYTRSLADELKRAAEAEGYRPQLALFENFASDATAIGSAGHACRAGALCISTQNTHGFEIIHRGSIGAATATLTRHLLTANG